MPLTNKGQKIMNAMKAEYGKKGESVFYASKNAGKIKGVEGREEEMSESITTFAKKLRRRAK